MCRATICSPAIRAVDVNMIVERARACVGTAFRLHGRDPAHGLDCIGLIGWALDRVDDVPRGYALRGGDPAAFAVMIEGAGLLPVTDRRAGDVLLMQAGPAQVHFAIWTGTSLIHADAGLRRVVERPGAPPWPVLGQWRAGLQKREI